MGLFSWFRSLFGKIRATIKWFWTLANPFLKEVLSETAQNLWLSTQALFVEAAQYVATQGLPTDEAKREAFAAYMKERLGNQISELKTSELNLLREMAVAIAKKIAAEKL